MHLHPFRRHLLFLAGLCAFLTAAWVRADAPVPPPEPPALPDPGPIPLPPPTLTVAFRPELRGQHPRLFFDAAGLEALRKKMADPRSADLLKGFLLVADHDAQETPPDHPRPTEDPFRPYGDRLPRAALAYLLTNDPKYLASARAWMKALSNYPSWAGDHDLGAGHCCFGMAVAYDWLYSALTPDERQEIEAALLKHGRLLLTAATPMKPGGWWGWAYFQNHCWINHTGIAAAAMALYDLHPEEMQGWLDFTRTVFQPTYKEMGIDGGNHEGPAYARYGTQWLFLYIDTLRGISGENLYDMAYLKGIGNYFIYNQMPNWKDLANFEDCPPQGWGRIDDEILIKLAAEYHDGRMITLLHDTQAADGHSNSRSPYALIWFDPSVEAKPIDDLPTTGLYPDLGLVIFRTGWDASAAVVSFHCGPPGGLHAMRDWKTFPNGAVSFGHSHPDAGSFLFWADNAWRIGAPGAYTHNKVTHNENVWLVDGKGQRGEGQWFDASPYLNQADQPRLLQVGSTPKADYAVGEAAPAYDPACGLTRFRRHLLFVKGPKPYLVVYDRLAANAPRKWSSYLHAYQAFQTGEGSFTIADPTAASGLFFGPGKLGLDTHPLTVLSHPESKLVDQGFELVASPEGATPGTWLVTVIGVEKQNAVFTGTDAAPALKVGDDRIAWDAGEGVTFNGKDIAPNLLNVP